MTASKTAAPAANGLITGMGAALVDLFASVSDAGVDALGSPKA